MTERERAQAGVGLRSKVKIITHVVDDVAALNNMFNMLKPIAAGTHVIVPKEPGTGFWGSVQRALEADGPDDLSETFREWNRTRLRAMIAAKDTTA